VIGLIRFRTTFGLPFAVFLLRNFFIGIPKDLIEASTSEEARRSSAIRRHPRRTRNPRPRGVHKLGSPG
jgi:alpha-glucoside transport system permease protein